MRVKRCGAGQGMETPGTVTEDWGPEQGSGDPGQQGSDGQQGSLQPLRRDTFCGYGTQARPLPWMPAPGRVSSSGPLQVLCLPEGRAATEASLDVEWGAVCSRALVGSP